MKFSDFRIVKKLIVGFGAVVCVIMLSSVFVFLQTNGLREYLRLNNVSDEAIDHVDQMRGDVTAAQSAARKLVVTGVEGDKAAYSKALNAYAEHLASVKTILAKDGPELLPQLTKYETAVSAHVSKGMGEEVKLALNPATRSQAVDMILSGVLAPEIAALEEASTALHNDVNRWSDSWTDKANASMWEVVLVVVGSGVLSTILAGLMGWLLARTIGGPIRSVTQTMQGLAAGNTAVVVSAIGRKDEIGEMADAVQVFKEAAIEKVRLEAESDAARRASDDERARNAAVLAEAARQQGQVVESLASGLARLSEGNLVFRLNNAFTPDYEQLRSDFNAAIGKLHNTMKLVATNATTIRSGTSEISTASDDLSRRTEQQAASLEETAAALDEITSTVRRTAEGAKHASTVVSGAKAEAEQSSRVVRQAVEAMGGIQKSSREIGNIIGVIDEIAFQTNLLALNAGVEAARAGDAGRGFAVVASEVRALAQRSAEAAKEIKSLISTSGAQVEQGVAFVGQTGEALARMMAQVNEIDGIVGEISTSAQEQATALHQVNTAVNQMDQVTQQNAAMVEESTAASQSLSEQTGELARLIDQFQVGDAGAPPARRPAPAAKSARPSQAPVQAMRAVGRGGATRAAEPAGEDWTEF